MECRDREVVFYFFIFYFGQRFYKRKKHSHSFFQLTGPGSTKTKTRNLARFTFSQNKRRCLILKTLILFTTFEMVESNKFVPKSKLKRERKKTRHFGIVHFDSVSSCDLLRVVTISAQHGIRKQVTVLIALLPRSHQFSRPTSHCCRLLACHCCSPLSR